MTSQDHQNVNRRKCTLIQMVVKIKKGWVSGPKFCGRDGRYHHIICFYIFMIHDLECKEESTVNNMLKTKKMKNICLHGQLLHTFHRLITYLVLVGIEPITHSYASSVGTTKPTVKCWLSDSNNRPRNNPV